MDGEKKKKRKRKPPTGCCYICYLVGQKLFTFFFPGRMKKTKTNQGAHLRWLMGATVFGHCMFFFISLAIIGFVPMIENLMFAAWTYSIYLTLREWLLITYMIALLVAMYENIKAEKERH